MIYTNRSMQRRGRRVNSIYARPPATTITSASQVSAAGRNPIRPTASTSNVATATAGQVPVGQSQDSQLLLVISQQMKSFAESLESAQRACDTTQALFLEKCGEQDKLIAEHRSASLAESRALSSSLQQQFQHAAPAFVWKSKGNEANHKYNCGTLNNYIEIDTALESEEWQGAKDFVRTGIKATLLRNKCIKMADVSPAGWGLVEEYLANELADDDSDDRKIRKCEAAALEKIKKRREESNGNKRGRGANNSNNSNNSAGQNNGKAGGKGKAANTAESSTAVTPAIDPLTLALLQNQLQSFLPATLAAKAPPKKLGPCYVCQGDHLQNDCPYVRAQRIAYQQHMASQIANAPGNVKT